MLGVKSLGSMTSESHEEDKIYEENTHFSYFKDVYTFEKISSCRLCYKGSTVYIPISQWPLQNVDYISWLQGVHMIFQFLEYLVTVSIMESTIKEPRGLQIQKVLTLLGLHLAVDSFVVCMGRERRMGYCHSKDSATFL